MNYSAPKLAGFTPEEIEVNVYGDKVTVHLQHDEETNPDGELSREVNRAFKIPKDIDPSSIKSYLNEHGDLQITARKTR
ncbi:HSP-12.2 protein [Aphelenchoides avenae]|nr:HSP-12.2 protein [Aphelenchus avenae]